MPLGSLHIGTSGYSFEDWRGSFYPVRIAKGQMLEHYARFFDTVEINATYYAIPHSRVFASMLKRVPGHFTFMVKAHTSATHRRDLIHDETPKFLQSIAPLAESSQLTGVLLQFPWSFSRSKLNERHLELCRKEMPNLPLFIEFRHASWIRPEVMEKLRSLNLNCVSVDEPQLPQMVPPTPLITGDVAYVRFHGRNAAKWYSGSGHDRYDYLYSEDELKEWLPKIEEIRLKVRAAYLYFNNCHLGQAATNAKQMAQLLGLTLPRSG
ncbi:MAG: DUF72 domain-containing protein [Candidatus Zixiibacteriota bacterium]